MNAPGVETTGGTPTREEVPAIDLRLRSFDRPEKASRSFARWFIFGEGPAFCDLSDGEGDVLHGVPVYLAERAIAAREAYLQALEEIFVDAPYMDGDKP